ncbi:hypothetical protein Tco_0800756, partial [Tanacetum coccineum]
VKQGAVKITSRIQKALKLQAFLDVFEDDGILQGYDAIERRIDTLSAPLLEIT